MAPGESRSLARVVGVWALGLAFAFGVAFHFAVARANTRRVPPSVASNVVEFPDDVVALLRASGFHTYVMDHMDRLTWRPHLEDSAGPGLTVLGTSHYEGHTRVVAIAFATLDTFEVAAVAVHEAAHFAYAEEGGRFMEGEPFARAMEAKFRHIARRVVAGEGGPSGP